mgnify:CR=1 FL=1
MAKSDFGSKKELQEYINSLKEIDAQYKELNRLAKEHANIPGKAKQEILNQLKGLRQQFDTHKEILASIKQAEKELASYEKTQKICTVLNIVEVTVKGFKRHVQVNSFSDHVVLFNDHSG